MADDATLDPAVHRGLYRTMSLIKQCDDRFRTMLSSGQIFIVYYSPRGQEAVSAGVGAHLRPDDSVVTTYRGLHDHLAKGVDLRGLWAEFLGKSTGLCKGKGGPMHITSPSDGLMVTTGIVGAGLPIANGFAMAAQLEGSDAVTVVNFGDGASNIGAFHEAVNLAAIWKLPVVFVCQNNLYAEHTAFEAGTAGGSVAGRASAYGIAGQRVDGNDPVEVYLAAQEAVRRARAGEGPTILECMTYRFHGHVVGDAMEYQPPEERAAAMAADPVDRYRARLVADAILTEAELADIDSAIAAEIDDAVEFAQSSPAPDLSELYTDVYAGEVSP
jgi:acetoin:2,6-dichlorophenolindophenol oxidoreductase subunit alpha